jgi:hypothetical protein
VKAYLRPQYQENPSQPITIRTGFTRAGSLKPIFMCLILTEKNINSKDNIEEKYLKLPVFTDEVSERSLPTSAHWYV